MSRSVEVDSAARIGRFIDKLAEWVDSSRPGFTRRSFSEQDRLARTWLAERMAEEGLSVRLDSAGNLWAELAGRERLPQLVVGSHTDTVDGGGRFDGMAGVAAALEAVHLLRQSSVSLRHPLSVVDFLAEEPSPFGLSTVGSRAVSGHLPKAALTLTDRDGRTLEGALRAVGGDPDRLLDSQWPPGSISGFLELHIEQGPVLERQGRRLAVVQGIVGIERHEIHVFGTSGHAGTVPMAERQDALVASSRLVLAMDRAACDLKGQAVLTVGRCEIRPGALNVIPGEAALGIEWRALDSSVSERLASCLDAELVNLEREGYRVTDERVSMEPPVHLSPAMQDLLAETLAQRGHPDLRLPSWAGHDAVQMAHVTPNVGMLFVPSRNGVSHCADEWTDPTDIAEGAACLAEAISRMDRAL